MPATHELAAAAASSWRTSWTTPQIDRARRLMAEPHCLKCGGNHGTAAHGNTSKSVAPPVSR